MAGFPQQSRNRFQRDSSPAVGVPWNTAAIPAAPQQPQSAPSSYLPPSQPSRASVFPPLNATGNRPPNGEGRADMPSPLENVVDAQLEDQPQNLIFPDMTNYDMNNIGHPPAQGHRDHILRGNAQNVPAQAHIAPPLAAPEVDAFIFQDPPAAAGSAPAFLDDLPHQVPVPNERATEALRQLAIVYLRDPNSQVAGIRMEPGHVVDGVMVVIAVRLTNF